MVALKNVTIKKKGSPKRVVYKILRGELIGLKGTKWTPAGKTNPYVTPLILN